MNTTASNSKVSKKFVRGSVSLALALPLTIGSVTITAKAFADSTAQSNTQNSAPSINQSPEDAQNNPNSSGMVGDEGSSPNQKLGMQGNQDSGQKYQDENGQPNDNSSHEPRVELHRDGISLWPILTALLAITLAGVIAFNVGHRRGRSSASSPAEENN